MKACCVMLPLPLYTPSLDWRLRICAPRGVSAALSCLLPIMLVSDALPSCRCGSVPARANVRFPAQKATFHQVMF
jgi:hypothetical protein